MHEIWASVKKRERQRAWTPSSAPHSNIYFVSFCFLSHFSLFLMWWEVIELPKRKCSIFKIVCTEHVRKKKVFQVEEELGPSSAPHTNIFCFFILSLSLFFLFDVGRKENLLRTPMITYTSF